MDFFSININQVLVLNQLYIKINYLKMIILKAQLYVYLNMIKNH
jgi:hypothetical protein